MLLLVSCYGKRVEHKSQSPVTAKDKAIDEIIRKNEERIHTVDSIIDVTDEKIDDVVDSFGALKRRIKALRSKEKIMLDTIYISIEEIRTDSLVKN